MTEKKRVRASEVASEMCVTRFHFCTVGASRDLYKRNELWWHMKAERRIST